MTINLDHSVDQLANEDLVVTVVTTLVEVQELLAESAVGGGQLERPEEVSALLEVGSDGVDLVDQILDGEDSELAEDLLNLLVLHQRNALLVQLGETTLVDQLADGLEVGVTVSDVGLDQTEHFDGGLVQAHEDGVVDLAQAEELQGLLHLGRGLVDTTNTDDDSNATLGLSEQVSVSTGISSLGNQISLHLSVPLGVLGTALDHLLSLGLLSGDQIGGGLLSGSLQLSITALLHKNRLGTKQELANDPYRLIRRTNQSERIEKSQKLLFPFVSENKIMEDVFKEIRMHLKSQILPKD